MTTTSGRRTALGLLGLTLLTAGLVGCRDPHPSASTPAGAGQVGAAQTQNAPGPDASGSAGSAATPAGTPTATAGRVMQTDGQPGVPCVTAPAVPKAPPPPLPLSGDLGLWVAQVDPHSLRVIRAVGTNPDSVFPLASTYKQAVLWAVLREFDAGRLSPTQRFTVTRHNQSLGAYPFDGMTVRALSERMIQWSDNTATDILHRRVGLRTVQGVADRLGLCRSRFILPTRDWWVSQAGLSETFNGTRRWAGATGAERARLASLIDHDAQAYPPAYVQRKLDDYFDHRYQPADDLRVHNLSTPYELGTLLTHEFLDSGLSPRAQAWQRDVMARGFGRRALKADAAQNVAWFGGKGGNGWRILTYSGYIETKDGRRVVYAFMQHGSNETYTMPNTRRAFAWINAGIDAVIGVQTPRPPVKATDPAQAATPAARARAEAVKGASKPLPGH